MSIYVGVIGNSRKASTTFIEKIRNEVLTSGLEYAGPYHIGELDISNYTYHGYEIKITPGGQDLTFLKETTPEYVHLEVSIDANGFEFEDLLRGFAAEEDNEFSEQIASRLQTMELNLETDTPAQNEATQGHRPATNQDSKHKFTAPDQTVEELTEPNHKKLRKQVVEESIEADTKDDQETKSYTAEYTRSATVRDYVKARAGDHCEGCGDPAPFISTTGMPYFHAHHIDELSDGGADNPQSVIALCPNCHYRVHHGQDGDQYNEILRQKLSKIES